MRQLKVYKRASGLLGPNYQIVLSLVEDSGSEGFKIDDLVELNGLDHVRIPKILQELQQLGLVHAKGEISQRRWYLLKEDNGCNPFKSQGGIQWKTVSKMVQRIRTKMVKLPQKRRM